MFSSFRLLIDKLLINVCMYSDVIIITSSCSSMGHAYCTIKVAKKEKEKKGQASSAVGMLTQRALTKKTKGQNI